MRQPPFIALWGTPHQTPFGFTSPIVWPSGAVGNCCVRVELTTPAAGSPLMGGPTTWICSRRLVGNESCLSVL